MARELYISGDGLKIAKVGFDAAVAAEENLVFSSFKQLMRVDSGTISSLSGTMRVNFATSFALTKVPFILCGVRRSSTEASPVRVDPDLTGFYVRAVSDWSGALPANGKSLSWVALLMGVPT